MNGCQVSYVFFFFAVAMTIVAVQSEETSADVSISDTTITLTCPFNDDDDDGGGDVEKVIWEKAGVGDISNGKILTLSEYTDKKGGLYHCSKGKDPAYYFFIKAKVCEGCVDMDMMMAFALIFGDVLITVGIVVMVYLCARKKAGTAAPQRATQARQPGGRTRGPPVPDPDYQPLNPATRANDVYAQANRR